MQPIITRDQSGLVPPSHPISLVPFSFRTSVMLHHSGGITLGDPDPIAWWRNIQRYHMQSNGWADIAYNAGVAADGRILEGRSVNHRGSHCYPPAYPDYNTLAWSICYLNEGPITPQAKQSVIDLCRLFAYVHHTVVPDTPAIMAITFHRNANHSTECPGDDIVEWYDAGMPA